MTPAFEPLPPHNTEAEESVLGSILIDPAAIGVVADWLEPAHFYHPRNRELYACMIDIHRRQQPTDFVVVADELERTGAMERVGGITNLSRMLAVVPTSIHIEHYAIIVQRTATQRAIISAAGRIAAIGYQDNDIDATIAQAQAELASAILGARTSQQGPVALGELLSDYLVQINIGDSGEQTTSARLPTGYEDIDELLGGLNRSDLVLLAARPSVGKSALALNIARNAALTTGETVLVFSLEMSATQVASRLLSAESGIEAARIRTGDMVHDEMVELSEALERLSAAPIWVDDERRINLGQLLTRARRLHNDHPLGLVIVDYLGLIRGPRPENRVQEVSEISAALKGLAGDLNVPVLALSQLNRGIEHRQDTRPLLSDLRDSGSLEQDADVVMFLHRDNEDVRDVVTATVAKHRHGPIGVVRLAWQAKTTLFRSLRSA